MCARDNDVLVFVESAALDDKEHSLQLKQVVIVIDKYFYIIVDL